jgi:serine/threonine protein kinase
MNLFDGRYEKEDLIGRGAFSEVWRVTDTYTNTVMALKIFISNSDIDEDGLEMLKREFALMIDADHQNLLRPMFFGVSSENKLPYLTLPYCKGGNINKMMGRMTEREAWKLLRDTASALAYLHAMDPPIIHQDIKPANILIGNDGYYKLSDFGVSIQARSTLSNKNHQDSTYISAGTISYMAPEKFSRDNLPIMANDIYSLGSTVYEMLSGYLPFGIDGGLTQKKGADVPVLPGNYSSQLKKVLEDCLSEEPWKRPTASKLEEIAVDVLSKAPTVMINVDQESVSDHSTEEVENGFSFGTHAEQKDHKKNIIIGVVAVIVLLALGAYFFFYSNSDGPAAEQTLPAISQSPIEEIKEPVEEKKVPVEVIEVKEDPVITTEPKVVNETKKTEVKKTVAPLPAKSISTNKELDLGYAVWDGKSVNGKPHGYGTMTFRDACRIDSRDDQGRVAQSGDKVKGNYINGHLEYGTWIKSNGEQIEIFIGQ